MESSWDEGRGKMRISGFVVVLVLMLYGCALPVRCVCKCEDRERCVVVTKNGSVGWVNCNSQNEQ